MVLKGRLCCSFLASLSFLFLLGFSLTNNGALALGSPDRGPDGRPAAGRSGSISNPASHQAEMSTVQTTSFAGVLTWHNNNSRDGRNLFETILTLSNVTQTTFGVLFTRAVDGFMYAQPLYMPNVTISGAAHNVVYVTTANDSVYAFDADGNTSTALWQTSFINSAAGITTIPSSDTGCKQIAPLIGITGTPVIDPTTNTMYLVAATKQSGSDSYMLHALDITTGKDKFGGPVTISATSNGVSFVPKEQAQRPALLLAHGNVYIGFGSHCDIPPYHGWLMAYNAATLAQTSVFLTTPTGTDGSLWNGGAGPSADSSHIFVTTANGTFDANTGGLDYGDSFLKFSTTLSLLDYFTPFNEVTLGSTDLDVGSSGVLIPPTQTGAHPHIMISAGKEGRIYVVDRDNLGHFQSSSDSQIVQSIVGAFPSVSYTTGAYWNGHVYFAANGDFLKDYTLTNGLLSTSPVKQNTYTMPYPGVTPAVSSNGTNNAIVWTLEDRTIGATLSAHNATDVSQLLYNGSGAVTALGVKFAVPTVANGRVYIGTQTELVVFGLL